MSTNRCEPFWLLEEGDDLFEFLLGFCDACDVVEHHTGLSFHHEFGLAFAKLHRLTWTARHVAVASGQENQGSDQEQWEQQIAQEAERWRGALGGVDIKADAFLLQRVDQLRGQARQINTQTLYTII